MMGYTPPQPPNHERGDLWTASNWNTVVSMKESSAFEDITGEWVCDYCSCTNPDQFKRRTYTEPELVGKCLSCGAPKPVEQGSREAAFPMTMAY